MINNVVGEKTIYLSYPIHPRKEITVISMLSDNIQYEMTEPFKLKLIDDSEKQVLHKTYTSRELSALVEGKMIITNLTNDPRIIKMNKLAKITDMIFNLDEPDNTDNLEDGRPSSTLFMYYVSGSEDFTHFEPKTPQYEKLKNGEIVSLTMKITDKNNSIVTNGLGTTVVLHIR